GVVVSCPQHDLRAQPLAALACAGDGGVDLGPDPEAAPAYGLQSGAADRAQARQHVLAEHAAAVDQALFADDAQRFEPDRCGERVAAEGRSVRAGREDVHDFALGDEGGYRQHAAAERLAEDKAIRPDGLVLERAPAARRAGGGLRLAANHGHAVRVAQRAHAGKIARGRHDDAGLALDRLDQNRGGVERYGTLDRLEVTERHRAEARRERPEALAIGRL